jgi:SAM-dependent methyltransferase
VESLYRLMHRLGITPWENNRTPRALTIVADGPSHPGIALDLGCGTGAHAVHLAGSGWQVIGVDVSRRAIEHARARSTRVDWRVVDFTRETEALDDLAGRVDLLLDVGCLHGLSDIGRRRWAHVARLVARPNARALVWASAPRRMPYRIGPRGISPTEVQALLGPTWSELDDRTDPSWYHYRRRP